MAPLIVVSGPAGVGKTTVVDALVAHRRFPVRRAVTATTRNQRPGEVDGTSYHFWSVEQFREALNAGKMLEWEIVHGLDYYGTPRDEVDRDRSEGIGVILVIDVKGAATIRAAIPATMCRYSSMRRSTSWRRDCGARSGERGEDSAATPDRSRGNRPRGRIRPRHRQPRTRVRRRRVGSGDRVRIPQARALPVRDVLTVSQPALEYSCSTN